MVQVMMRKNRQSFSTIKDLMLFWGLAGVRNVCLVMCNHWENAFAFSCMKKPFVFYNFAMHTIALDFHTILCGHHVSFVILIRLGLFSMKTQDITWHVTQICTSTMELRVMWINLPFLEISWNSSQLCRSYHVVVCGIPETLKASRAAKAVCT